MPKAILKDNKIFIDAHEIPLLSGEIHYWRLNPLYWEKCLQRTREMGLQIIASYVCWDFHEYEPDKFDFHGKTNPARNLVAFLELLENKDFWIIIRPGPYIYSEWSQAGIPERFSRLHRMQPDFLKAAKFYMSQIVEVLKPHFVTNGGRIYLLQADNEIDPFCQAYGDQLGLYGGHGLFQEFLKEKYETLAELNKAWQQQFQDFSATKATMTPLFSSPEHRRQYFDFREFRQWFTNKKAWWMIDQYRTLGVDIPIYLNSYPSPAVQNWRELSKIADLVGIDQYPTNEFSHLPEEHFTFYKQVSYASSVLRIPHIAEFESGIWHGWHYNTKVLTANHYRLACLTALAGGIIGWNWYMLVDRDNWYMSPINPKGNIRPELFNAFKDIVAVFQKVKPAHWQKLTAIAVTYNENHLAAEAVGHQNKVMKALYQADIDFECCDLLNKIPNKKLLFYDGPTWLSQQEQQNLIQFVQNGGHLVCFQTFPYLDENFESCNLLDFQFPDGTTLKKKVRVNEFVELESSLFEYSTVPGEPIIAVQIPSTSSFQEESALYDDLEVGKTIIIGYKRRIGKGSISLVGCEPTTELLNTIVKNYNFQIYSQAKTRDVYTALFKNGEFYFLIIINNGNEDKAVKVWLSNSIFKTGKWKCIDLFNNSAGDLMAGENPFMIVEVKRKDGTIILIESTNEIEK